ncbi:MAG: T9SS type A sorting domain-containing protein, partial [Bacteroidota bacterium]
LTTFPNPAVSNHLNLRFESTEHNNLIVRVYDFTGRLISQQEELVGIGEQILEVDIAALPAGSYLLRLENGKKLSVAKFSVP